MPPNKWQVKIDDFGICGPSDSVSSRKLDLFGIRDANVSTRQSIDVFCLGEIVFWLLTQVSPFSDYGLLDTFLKEEAPLPIELLREREVDDVVVDFVRLLIRPSCRPTVSQAFTQAWMEPFTPPADNDLPPSYEEVAPFVETAHSFNEKPKAAETFNANSEASISPSQSGSHRHLLNFIKEQSVPKAMQINKGECTIQYPGQGVQSLQFTPDSRRIILISGDGHVHQVDVEHTEYLESLWKPDLKCPISAVVTLQERQVATGSYDGLVRIWDTTLGFILCEFRVHPRAISALAYISDPPLLVAASSDDSVSITCLRTRRTLHKLRGHFGRILSLAATEAQSGCLVATGSSDGTLCIWDPVRGALLHKIRCHSPHVLAFSPDGMQLAALSSDRRGLVTAWSIERLTRTSLTLSLDVPASAGGCYEQRDYDSRQQLVPHIHAGTSMGLSFSTWRLRGKHVAQACLVRETEKNACMYAFTSQGKSKVYYYNAPAFLPSAPLPHVVCMSPDGKWLATVAEEEAVVRLWDLTGVFFEGSGGKLAA
jgi:WD40 repeat protein